MVSRLPSCRTFPHRSFCLAAAARRCGSRTTLSPWKPTPADEGVTLLTLGGKTRNGTALRVVGLGDLQVRTPTEWVTLGRLRLGQWIEYEITLGKKSPTVAATGLKPRTFDLVVLGKISFGGLYLEPVSYPTEGAFRLDRARLRVW